MNNNNIDKSMALMDHLDELRGRLIKCVLSVAIASILAYPFVNDVLQAIIKPVDKIIFTSLSDAFMARITLTLILGIFLSLPFIAFQVWQFITFGLKISERRYIRVFVPASTILFLAGAGFAYSVSIPISIKFLLSYGSEQIIPMITIKNYITFFGSMMLAFGVIFELPLVMMFLTRLGIATPEFLVQKRKISIIIILIVSALVTPPDFITQLILAAPLIILYEAGIIVSKFTLKQESDN